MGSAKIKQEPMVTNNAGPYMFLHFVVGVVVEFFFRLLVEARYQK
jgi:hypothetical protein